MTRSVGKRPRITIVTPVFNEAENLSRYVESVTRTLLARADYDFHILFVDDGSQDESWAMIQSIARDDPRFLGVRLSRNFGPHVALSAGISAAEGDAVVTLACDLQDPPETILSFLERWKEGAAIVWGRRQKRDDSAWRVWASGLFEKVIRRCAMPRDSRFTTGSFLLMDRQVQDCFQLYGEQNRITFALVAWTGFEQSVVDYCRERRLAGRSSWKLRHLFKAAYDTFLGFSTVPVRVITILGAGLFLLSIPFMLYLLGCWVTGNPIAGWTSLMMIVTFFFGLQFLLMSILGEYLHRIFSEVVRRPLYFVSDKTREVESDHGIVGEHRHAA